MTKKSWLYEMPLFYLALWALQRGAFPDDPGFRGANPSPYWLGLALFGLRYGAGAGLASGLVSAGLYLAGTHQSGEGYRLTDADFYWVPGLLVAAGAALGAVRDHFAYRLGLLSQRVEGQQERSRALQTQLDLQQKALRAIEQQVVSQMSSVVTLYHGSLELGTLDRAALPRAALDFFTRALQATKTAMYEPKDGRLLLLDSRGWEPADAFAKTVELGSGVIGKAASERRVATARELGAGPGDAVMAAAILEPSGELSLVFAVHAMPFLRFNSASVNLLTLLAEWGTESLAKCAQVAALKERSLLDEEWDVHSARYFSGRLAQEFSRSRRDGSPLTVILVAVDDAAAAAERRPALLAALARVLREISREEDVVARSPWEEARFAALSSRDGRDLRDRIAQAVALLKLPAAVRVGVGEFSKDMKKPEDLIEKARADFR